MFLGRVIGSVVATRKEPKYEGKTLLVVQPLSLEGEDHGVAVVAVDSVGAGAGETVLVVVEGRSTAMAMDRKLAPANAAVVGIVDHIDWEK
jgi:ethanolamine utilization protein EutN